MIAIRFADDALHYARCTSLVRHPSYVALQHLGQQLYHVYHWIRNNIGLIPKLVLAQGWPRSNPGLGQDRLAQFEGAGGQK